MTTASTGGVRALGIRRLAVRQSDVGQGVALYPSHLISIVRVAAARSDLGKRANTLAQLSNGMLKSTFGAVP